MRLVCAQCSAVHTIEDNLVGGRDFHVACKQCGEQISVRHGQAATGPASGSQHTPSVEVPQRLSPRPMRPPASFSPTGQEQWFVWLGGKQEGPFAARQVAGLLEQGEMEWTTEVWRDGFKDWRPARRDATLVTAVAGARGGVANDTMRLNAARSFLAPEDTIVEARPNLFTTSSQRVSVAPRDELLSSASDTQAIDARELPDATEPIHGSLQAAVAPQQWHSPENAAFRAGLGLAQPAREAPPSGRPVAMPRVGGSAPVPSRSEAFRSAPTLLRGSPRPLPVMDPSAEYEPTETWLPKPRSLLLVAVLAFGGGVLAAAVASRYVTKKPESAPVQQPRAEALPAAPPVTPKVAPAPPVAVAVSPGEPRALPAPAGPSVAAIPEGRELPAPEELRREVRRVAPDVRRCITDPVAGVEVGVFIDGASGRVREIDVRSARLTAARVDCVIHAVKQIELAPFKRSELRLEHKFSW